MKQLTRGLALTLTLSLGFFLTGCDSGLTGTETESGPTASKVDATAKAQEGVPLPQPAANVALALEPSNPDEFVDAVQAGNWSGMWNQLTWDTLDPVVSREVALWGALVIDGERRKSFLVDFERESGGNLVEIGNAGVRPSDMLPGTKWLPGTSWRSGSELTGGNALPPTATFFQGNEWFPRAPFAPAPRNWAVNGIIDGIYTAPGAGVNAQLLIQPVFVDRRGPLKSADRRGSIGTAGIVVQFTKAE